MKNDIFLGLATLGTIVIVGHIIMSLIPDHEEHKEDEVSTNEKDA